MALLNGDGPTAIVLDAHLPADRNPALVYIASLAPGSRRTMTEALAIIAGMVARGVRVETFACTTLASSTPLPSVPVLQSNTLRRRPTRSSRHYEASGSGGSRHRPERRRHDVRNKSDAEAFDREATLARWKQKLATTTARASQSAARPWWCSRRYVVTDRAICHV
jgi:hypothetical protein